MKLHWSPKSPYVRKVMIALHELSLLSEVECIRTVAVMKSPNPTLMADNPLGKIPTLALDDGRVIIDSFAICDYLDERAGGGRLFPARGAARIQALAWHALGSGLTDILILWRNEREKAPAQQTPEWISAFGLKTRATLARLEENAEELAAAPFSIGHIGVGCALSYMDFRFEDLRWREDHPRLAAWHVHFSARPSALATEVVDA